MAHVLLRKGPLTPPRTPMRKQLTFFAAAFAALAAVGSLSGCADGEGRDDLDDKPGPGNAAWDSDDVSCTEDAQCGSGELCQDGLCQMARCLEDYASIAPMGANLFFGIDGEFAITGDGNFVDGFESEGSDYLGSLELPVEVLDVAGGNYDGSRPQGIAVASPFSDEITISGASGPSTLRIGIWPIALASGDIDADGLDELVALGEDGTIAACDVDVAECWIGEIDDSEGGDVAVADVDGDGYDEPIFLLRYGGETTVVVWNTDAEKTQQDPVLGWEFNFPVKAISAGDLDGDGIGEVACLEDGGWWDLADDKLHIFSPAAGMLTLSHDVYGHSADIALGDRDSDEKAEIALLREDHKFELIRMTGSGALDTAFISDITVGQTATRLTFVDWDGDSASGRLVEGPELVAGDVVPTAVLLIPPYDEGIANGRASSFMGSTEVMSETYSDTIGLHLGMTVGYGFDIGGIVKAKVNAYLAQDFSKTHATSVSRTVGGRYVFEANIEDLGDDFAVVMTQCGCFHRYRYQTEDPANKVGGDGQVMDVFMPVGGQTLIYSSKRYNALAEKLGTLPIIPVTPRIGHVDSYNTAPLSLAGAEINPEDFLFANVPTFQVSDVAKVGFWLSGGEYEVNGQAQTTTLGANGSVGIFGADVQLDANTSISSGYEVRVGDEFIFAGSVPAVPDNPDTPEDEFELWRYAYSPYVYREHYVDKAGEDAGYYVLNYTVGR